MNVRRTLSCLLAVQTKFEVWERWLINDCRNGLTHSEGEVRFSQQVTVRAYRACIQSRPGSGFEVVTMAQGGRDVP